MSNRVKATRKQLDDKIKEKNMKILELTHLLRAFLFMGLQHCPNREIALTKEEVHDAIDKFELVYDTDGEKPPVARLVPKALKLTPKSD